MSESARILKLQREFFNSGATLPVEGRKVALHRLLNAVTAREAEILAALQQDLGKAPMEGYLTEVGIVKAELRTALKHLDGWARPPRGAHPADPVAGSEQNLPRAVWRGAGAKPVELPVSALYCPGCRCACGGQLCDDQAQQQFACYGDGD